MLTVIVTAKTGLYQYNMQRVGGVGIRDFWILRSYLLLKELGTAKGALLGGCGYCFWWNFVLVITSGLFHDKSHDKPPNERLYCQYFKHNTEGVYIYPRARARARVCVCVCHARIIMVID
jgi:hypothetical protein